ncbi:MAG: hypothetical protein IBJ10_11980, partial [Phycisphaerales bacterium]|nr:hypothetical protein [Phycisphaerales bacterium]
MVRPAGLDRRGADVLALPGALCGVFLEGPGRHGRGEPAAVPAGAGHGGPGTAETTPVHGPARGGSPSPRGAVAGGGTGGAGGGAGGRGGGAAFAAKLSVRVLSRAWQILLAGAGEVEAATRPLAAAEMVLVRLCYAADLPTPDEALKALRNGATPPPAAPRSPGSGGGGGGGGSAASGGGPVLAASRAEPLPRAEAAPQAAPTLRLARFEDVVALAGEKRELVLRAALERDVRLVRFEDGQIEFALAEGGSRTLANDLTRA